MSVTVFVTSARPTDRATRSHDRVAADVAAALGVNVEELAAAPIVGQWHGERENSLAIPVRGYFRDIYALAYALGVRLKQDAVMVLVSADDPTVHLWLEHGGQRAIVTAAEEEDHSVQHTGTPVVDVPNGTPWTVRTTASNDNAPYVVAFV